MQISITNLWKNPGLTLTQLISQGLSSATCPSPSSSCRSPLSIPLPFPSSPTAGGLRPGAHLTDSCWFGSLHHTPDKRGIQDSFVLLPLLRSSLQSPPQTQFPGIGLQQGLLMKSFPAHMIGWDCHHHHTTTTIAAATTAAAAATIPTLPAHISGLPSPHLHPVYSCGNSKWLCAFSVCIHSLHHVWVCVCTFPTRVMCVCVSVCLSVGVCS